MDFIRLINRVLIVGLGSIGKRHLRLARMLLPNADIRILRHQTNATKDSPENSNGCFYNIKEAADFSPQLAVIANPAPFHIDIANVLAEIGTHILIEKPLSTSLNGIKELIETCKKKNIVLLIGYNLRFSLSLKHFRGLLEKGIIGNVLSVRCEVGQYLPTWRPELDYRKSVSANRKLGGGVLFELSHEIDYLNWIFGNIEWTQAKLSHQSGLEIDVEDSAHIIFGFVPKTNDHQIIGTANLDFIRHDATRICIAIGENGSLRWNGLTGEVSIYEPRVKKWVDVYSHQDQRDDTYLAEWENFIACIIGNETPLVSGKDGLKVLQIIESIKLSTLSNGQKSMVSG